MLRKVILLVFIVAFSACILSVENSIGDPPSPTFKFIKDQAFVVEEKDTDSKLKALLENADPSDPNSRYNTGTVQKQKDGKEWLMVNGKKVFEGYSLSHATSSSDGTIAVSSYNGLGNQIDGDGSDEKLDKNGKAIQSTASIWIIKPSGAKYKITSDNMHATFPIISLDGRWVAFSGVKLDHKGFFIKPLPAGQQVYIVSLKESVAGTPTNINVPSIGTIWPIKWDHKLELIIGTTESENSAIIRLNWVQVTP